MTYEKLHPTRNLFLCETASFRERKFRQDLKKSSNFRKFIALIFLFIKRCDNFNDQTLQIILTLNNSTLTTEKTIELGATRSHSV